MAHNSDDNAWARPGPPGRRPGPSWSSVETESQPGRWPGQGHRAKVTQQPPRGAHGLRPQGVRGPGLLLVFGDGLRARALAAASAPQPGCPTAIAVRPCGRRWGPEGIGAPQFCKQGKLGPGHGRASGWSIHSPWDTDLRVLGSRPGACDLGQSRWHLGKRGDGFTESRPTSCVLGGALCPRGREGQPRSAGSRRPGPGRPCSPPTRPRAPGDDVLTRQSGHSCLAPEGREGRPGRRWHGHGAKPDGRSAGRRHSPGWRAQDTPTSG